MSERQDPAADGDDEGYAVGPYPRALCPTCAGMGTIMRPRAAVMGGSGRIVVVPEQCHQCQGERFLPGLIPPA